MIKAVLFDYGGVMSDGGRGVEITERIAANLGVSQERAFELLDVGWTLYSSGTISEDDFWKMLEESYGQPVSSEKRDIWNAWEVMQPKPEMLEFVEDLKSRGLRVGLLSNVIPYTMDQIRSHGVYDKFEFTVLSAEVGYGKPDEEIYQIALDKLPGITAAEVVFIDDQERMLEPAIGLGMHTIRAQTPDQIIDDVNKLINELAREA